MKRELWLSGRPADLPASAGRRERETGAGHPPVFATGFNMVADGSAGLLKKQEVQNQCSCIGFVPLLFCLFFMFD